MKRTDFLQQSRFHFHLPRQLTAELCSASTLLPATISHLCNTKQRNLHIFLWHTTPLPLTDWIRSHRREIFFVILRFRTWKTLSFSKAEAASFEYEIDRELSVRLSFAKSPGYSMPVSKHDRAILDGREQLLYCPVSVPQLHLALFACCFLSTLIFIWFRVTYKVRNGDFFWRNEDVSIGKFPISKAITIN